jgi:hypothetical protein
MCGSTRILEAAEALMLVVEQLAALGTDVC